MLSAEQARSLAANKHKEWLACDLEQVSAAVVLAIEERSETFVAVSLNSLHKETRAALVSHLLTLGYRAFIDAKNLIVQWSLPAKTKDVPNLDAWLDDDHKMAPLDYDRSDKIYYSDNDNNNDDDNDFNV